MVDALLVVRIVTDYSKGAAGLDSAGGKLDRFGAKMSKLTVPAAAAVAGITAFGKAAIDSASRTQQAMGAVDSVFGRNAGQVKKWAAGAATSVGLAKSEYGELASVLGAQLKNMGLPMKQVAGQTNDLITLGADLAATYGGTTAEAVEALSAAFRGETDPIERYGVSVKQADIAAQQAADGTDKLTGAAGKQAKTMALLELVNKQTADAQGQFARESDSAAGAAQIAAAQYENMKSNLGTALLPVVAALSTALGGLANLVSKNTTAFQIIAGAILAVASAVLVINAALKVYQATLVVVGAVQKATWLTNPIFLVIAAVIALVAAVVILWRKSETFRAVVMAVWSAIRTGATAAANVMVAVFTGAWSAITAAWNGIKAAGMAVWNWIKRRWPLLLTILAGPFGLAVAMIIKHWSKVKAVLAAGWRVIKSGAQAAGRAISAVFRSAWRAVSAAARAGASVFRSVFNAIKAAGSAVARAVKALWSAAWRAITAVVRSQVSVIKSVFNGIRSVASTVANAVRNLFTTAFNAIKSAARSVGSAVSAPFDAIKSAVDSAISAVRSLIDWLGKIKVPDVGSAIGKLNPFKAVAPTPAPTVVGRAGRAYTAPAVPRGAYTGRRAATGAPAGGSVVINVTGAIDPEATARQIRRILAGHDRRVGLAT
jgi:phage-related protein